MTPQTPPSREQAKLHEITVVATYSIVVLAVSEADAMDHVKAMGDAVIESAERNGISDMELFDVRDATAEDWKDEAHEITDKAKEQS